MIFSKIFYTVRIFVCGCLERINGPSPGRDTAFASLQSTACKASGVRCGVLDNAAHQVAKEINGSEGRAISAVCDVTVKAEVEALFDQVKSKFSRIDVSIQNAGVITIAKIEDLTEEEWDRIMQVNTKGVFLCFQAAAKHMKQQRTYRSYNSFNRFVGNGRRKANTKSLTKKSTEWSLK